MESRILVNIGTDHAFECETNIIGRSGEGDITKLEITIPDRLHNCSVYLDFEMPNGEKLRTPKLEIEGGVAVYKVAQYLLTEKGELKVQLVFVNEGGAIWKSLKKRFNILKSINAEEEIPDKEDFITEAQKVLDELSGQVAEVAERLASDADFVDSVILAMETPTKVLTITGSILRFFVGTQAEYDALTDTSNLFAIITNDTSKEALENAIAELQKDCRSLESAVAELQRGGGVLENAIAELQKDCGELEKDIKDLESLVSETAEAVQTNADAIAENTEAIANIKHLPLLCSCEITNGTGTAPKDIMYEVCFVVFEGTNDTHNGIFYEAVNGDVHDCTLGTYSMALVKGGGGRAIHLIADGVEGSAINGTLKFYKIGVI
jgi:hypothetical protein